MGRQFVNSVVVLVSVEVSIGIIGLDLTNLI